MKELTFNEYLKIMDKFRGLQIEQQLYVAGVIQGFQMQNTPKIKTA